MAQPLVILLLANLATACLSLPDETACRDRLSVAFVQESGGRFSAGVYELVLTPLAASPAQLTCTLADGEPTCDGDGRISVTLEQQGAVLLLAFQGAPQTVTVTATFEGTLVGEQLLRPEYQLVTPNGPLADPLCYQARVELALSMPR